MKRVLDGRLFAPELTARTSPDGLRLMAPRVGLWRPRVGPGDLVTAGAFLGELEILGVLHRVLAPDSLPAAARVLPTTGRRETPTAVAYDDTLMQLEVATTAGTTAKAASASKAKAAEGLRFVAPLSGRFYARPSPDKPVFLSPGDTIREGDTVALLEVMKTFNRITYGGEGLPPTAKVKRVVPADGDDLDEGDVILELEP